MLRIYACSKEKDNEVSPKDATIMLSDSDTSSDFEPTDRRPIKTRRKQRQSEEPNQEISSLEDRNRSSSASHRETLRFRSSTQRLSAGTERRSKPLYADELFESDSALALAIHASMEDFEVQVGPISGYDGDDDTLPWNPHHLNSLQHSTLNDDAASPRGSEKEVHYVKFRRVNIVQDVLNVFMDPKVMEVQLIMELINEKALDGEGVSREVYSAFWELFLQQCEGEDERVPRLRPDYSEKEWQAVGRVWIKGYMDHNIIPIRLSPAFILSCCQGVSSVDEELLMMSFLRYLSVTERESVEKVLEGNLEEIDEEDLLDLFHEWAHTVCPLKTKYGLQL
ncbi:LPS-assembly lipoprotein LptE [Dissostichus eleginoides]|uniref:LPS-assembly lipoprotein LptE n=1 Tax=Dissostichus eleginoides TaxID=100907 RepID=A0AAD9EN11_DISEL|nr:LPS-assembly lipoprotein LptE [Dissostichus eleginoides]KAK1878682.1 LPS-assembly lipoprotein LptE [Dissostichus eleginoides]